MSDQVRAQSSELQTWLFDWALPIWWSVGANRIGGGFRDVIEQHGRPPDPAADHNHRRARVQTRQVIVYATAGTLGWGGAWREAVQCGLDFFLSRFARPDGLFRTRLAWDGSAADETAMLYDHAFALLALASAQAASPEAWTFQAEARALLERVHAHFAHPGGGYREGSPDQPFQSNPHMHLLEAALAWSEIDPQGPWGGVADQVVALCLDRFIDSASGAVREFFDAQWRPAEGLDGRIVEPGHQFEWAWLLTRWGEARARHDALSAARRLFQIGSSFGVDRKRGVAVQQMLDDFSIHDATARLWPQTEWIKASLILASLSEDEVERTALTQEAERATSALARYLATPVAGLWWDRLDAAGKFRDEAAPASSFYHIIGAIAALGPESQTGAGGVG